MSDNLWYPIWILFLVFGGTFIIIFFVSFTASMVKHSQNTFSIDIGRAILWVIGGIIALVPLFFIGMAVTYVLIWIVEVIGGRIFDWALGGTVVWVFSLINTRRREEALRLQRELQEEKAKKREASLKAQLKEAEYLLQIAEKEDEIEEMCNLKDLPSPERRKYMEERLEVERYRLEKERLKRGDVQGRLPESGDADTPSVSPKGDSNGPRAIDHRAKSP